MPGGGELPLAGVPPEAHDYCNIGVNFRYISRNCASGRGEKPAVGVPPGAHDNCNIGGHFHSLVSVMYHGIFPG